MAHPEIINVIHFTGAEEMRVAKHRGSITGKSMALGGDVSVYYKMHLHAKTEV